MFAIPEMQLDTPLSRFHDLARRMSDGSEVDTDHMLLVLALAGKTPRDLQILAERIAIEADARRDVLHGLGGAVSVPMF